MMRMCPCRTPWTHDDKPPHPRTVCLENQLAIREKMIDALAWTQRTIKDLRESVATGKETR